MASAVLSPAQALAEAAALAKKPPKHSHTLDELPPQFSTDGTRSTKYERILEAREGTNASVAIASMPESFKKNTLKESLVLEYVQHFRKQFIQLYPDRRPLMLTPLNEAGVPKFVCTTLRPTQLPFKELYDLEACARFVSAYVHYEPLEVPTEVPEYLPSPAFTLKTRVGDCFEMAVLLCSYLLGAGYDAYVAWGTAPKWVTLKTEDRSKCPWKPPQDAIDRQAHTTLEALKVHPDKAAKKPAAASSSSTGSLGYGASSSSSSSSSASGAGAGESSLSAAASRYKLPPPPSVTSEFLKTMAEKARLSDEASAGRKGMGGGDSSDEEDEDKELDRLRKERAPRAAGAGAGAGGRGRSRSRSAGATARVGGGASGAGAAEPEGAAGDVDDDIDIDPSNVDELQGKRIHAWVLVRAGRRQVSADVFVEPSTGMLYPVHGTTASNGKKELPPYLSVEACWNNKNYYVNMQAQPVLPRQPVGEDSQLAEAIAAKLNLSNNHSRASTPSRGRSASRLRTKSPGGGSRYFFGGAGGAVLPSSSAVNPADPLSTLPDKLKAPYAASLDPIAVAEKGLPSGAPVLGASALAVATAGLSASGQPKRPPLRGEVGHRGDGSATAGDPSGANSPSAGNSRAPSRGRSRGQTKPGSSEGWRRDLAATQQALHSRVTSILVAQAAAVRGMDRMQYNFANEDDWEYVMIPSWGSGHGEQGGKGGPGGSSHGRNGTRGGGSRDGLGTDDGFSGDDGGFGSSSSGALGDGGDNSGGSGHNENDNDGRRGRSRSPTHAGGGDGDGAFDSLDGNKGAGSNAGNKNASSGSSSSSTLMPGAVIEHDGEHVLDLPQSWVSKLTLDRHQVSRVLGEQGDATHVSQFYRSRLETFSPHSHPQGLLSRYTEYADTARCVVKMVVEVFGRRKDGLYKRVRYVDRQVIEQHFEKDHVGGIALVIDELGKRQELYFYHGSRVDGLVKRVHILGRKIMEHYGHNTPNRLWYRSITLAAPSQQSAAGAGAGGKGGNKPGSASNKPGSASSASSSSSSGSNNALRSITAPPVVEDTYSYMSVEVAPPKSVEVDEEALNAAGGGPQAASAIGSASAAIRERNFVEYFLNGDASNSSVMDPATAAAINALGSPVVPNPSMIGRTRKILVPVEQPVRKMTEKYRRDPSLSAHEDIDKVMFLIDADSIQVNFHHAEGRITSCSRLHHKAGATAGLTGSAQGREGAGVGGRYETLSTDPFAPVPRPFDIDNEKRKLLNMEKECHNNARQRSRLALEIVSTRVSDESGISLQPTLFEIAMERARAGAPLEDEPEKRSDSDEIDYLLPFLLAARCADVSNPTEKEARKADRECRAAYKERLLERVAIIQKRLEAENDDLLRRQQAFSRNRDHAEGAEEEFERFCAEATFRIGILEQRLERQEALVTKKYTELEAALLKDPRLEVIHHPAAYAARMAALAASKEEEAQNEAHGGANKGAAAGGANKPSTAGTTTSAGALGRKK